MDGKILFVKINKPPEFCKLQVQLLNTFRKSYEKLKKAKKGLLLPLRDSKNLLKDLAFQEERILLNVSNGNLGKCPNTDGAKNRG